MKSRSFFNPYWRFLRKLSWKKSVAYGSFFRLREGWLTADFCEDWPVEKALDAGCSGTVFPHFLAHLFPGARVLGLDNEKFVNMAIRNMRSEAEILGLQERVHLLFSDGRQLPFADGQFDLVTSISVLEHLEGQGDTEMARELCRVLKPGGLFIFSVPVADQFAELDRTTGCDYFIRLYDGPALEKRLIQIPGMTPFRQRAFQVRGAPYHLWDMQLAAWHGPLTEQSGLKARFLRVLLWGLRSWNPLGSRLFLRDWEVERQADWTGAGGGVVALRKAG